MSSAHSHLKNSFAIRGGKIDPWGTIRILDKSVKDYVDRTEDPISVQTGLVVWSEKLAKYGKEVYGNYHAKVTKKTVQVLTPDESIAKEIPHDEFLVVYINQARVIDDGHLQSISPLKLAGRESKLEREKRTLYQARVARALCQAAAGEKPCRLDNSWFVQIDQKFAGQSVIVLNWGPREDAHAAVFTESGEQIPCKVHHPLSYAKWETENKFAKFSIPDPVTS